MYFLLKLTRQDWGSHLLGVEHANPFTLLQCLQPHDFLQPPTISVFWVFKFCFVFELDLGGKFSRLSGKKSDSVLRGEVVDKVVEETLRIGLVLRPGQGQCRSGSTFTRAGDMDEWLPAGDPWARPMNACSHISNCTEHPLHKGFMSPWDLNTCAANVTTENGDKRRFIWKKKK